MYSNFVTFNARLETFSSWPIQLTQTGAELASAGFFYTGCGDKVRCFSGGCGLEMWEPGDTARLEHSKWYPDCSFVRMMGEMVTENTGSQENRESNENTGDTVNTGNTEEVKEVSESEPKNEYDPLCKICLVESAKGSFNNIKKYIIRSYTLFPKVYIFQKSLFEAPTSDRVPSLRTFPLLLQLCSQPQQLSRLSD